MTGILNVMLAGKAAAVAAAKSIVFSDTNDSHLTKTWSASSTDGKKSTLAFFVKFIGVAGAGKYYYSTGYDGHTYSYVLATASNCVGYEFIDNDAGPATYDMFSLDTIADTNWHHLTVSFDTTQATPGARVRIYIDGVEVSYQSESPIPQNTDCGLARNGLPSDIGTFVFAPTTCLDAKFAYFYFIDGQALTPSSFTTGTGAGTCHPAAYGGSYGTNGCKLTFNDVTTDQSGNGNDWTQVNTPTFDTDVPT
jgi:hypothetical protein